MFRSWWPWTTAEQPSIPAKRDLLYRHDVERVVRRMVYEPDQVRLDEALPAIASALHHLLNEGKS